MRHDATIKVVHKISIVATKSDVVVHFIVAPAFGVFGMFYGPILHPQSSPFFAAP
jgi:hypothetical protein